MPGHCTELKPFENLYKYVKNLDYFNAVLVINQNFPIFKPDKSYP